MQVGEATYVGWIDWSGRVTIGELDRRSGVTRAVVVARVYHDDHSDPSILVEPDGRLTVRLQDVDRVRRLMFSCEREA